jgi:signal peptidase I
LEKEAAIETLLDLLKRGNSAEISASGYSMFPTLRPGDRVLVNPLTENLPPVPGDILIVRNDDILILHRLLEIGKNNNGETVFITRGDSMTEPDPPAGNDQVIGTADSFRRNNRRMSLRSRITPGYEYRLNRVKLWVWFKIKKLKG